MTGVEAGSTLKLSSSCVGRAWLQQCELDDENDKQTNKPNRKAKTREGEKLKAPIVGVEIAAGRQCEKGGDAVQLVCETDREPDRDGGRNERLLADYRLRLGSHLTRTS